MRFYSLSGLGGGIFGWGLGCFRERIGMALCAALVFPFFLFLPLVNPGSTLRNKGFGGGAVVGGFGVYAYVPVSLLPFCRLLPKGNHTKKTRQIKTKEKVYKIRTKNKDKSPYLLVLSS